MNEIELITPACSEHITVLKYSPAWSVNS